MRVSGEARGGNDAVCIVDDEERSMGPQSPCALRVRGGAGPSGSLPLLRDDSHRGRRGASQPTPRRRERDPCYYSDTLLGGHRGRSPLYAGFLPAMISHPSTLRSNPGSIPPQAKERVGTRSFALMKVVVNELEG